MRVPVGAHWGQYAYAEADALGLSFAFVHADNFAAGNPFAAWLGDRAGLLASRQRWIVTVDFPTEAHLLDRDLWRAFVLERYAWMLPHHDRILGFIFGDELADRFTAHRGGALFDPARWRYLGDAALMKQDPWRDDRYFMDQLATVLADRAQDVRTIFAETPLGVGISVTGAYKQPVWWADFVACDFYLGPKYYPDPAMIRSRYAVAAHYARRILPVLSLGDEPENPRQSMRDLEACYLPILTDYAAQIAAIAVFPLHHPNTWDARHGPGRGILELGEPEVEAVRYLTTTFGEG